MKRPVTLIVLLLPAMPVWAAQEPQAVVGDSYAITRTQEMSETTGDEQRGSSSDRDAITERVIALRDGGVELEYDLPAGATAEDRAQDWHFPARIFKPAHGAARLINQTELEARVDPWLKAAKWTRAVCGHWIFTWNAFQIDCDPQTVLATIAAFDMRPEDLRDGALYREPDMLAAAPLQRVGETNHATFVVELAIDPESVRRDEAHADQIAGEITRKPIALDAAIRARATEQIAGTVRITFETDATGVVRKTSVIHLEIRKPGGAILKRVTTIMLGRRKVVATHTPAPA